MTQIAPAPRARTRRDGPRKRWSLLWVLRERTARRLSWLAVIALGVLPLALIGWQVIRIRSGAWRETVEFQLAAALHTPVALRNARLTAPGNLDIDGLAVNAPQDRVHLSAEQGTFQLVEGERSARLLLDHGNLACDLGWWAGKADPGLVHNLLTQKNLESMTLRDFAASLRLNGQEIALAEFGGIAAIEEDGTLVGSFGGHQGSSDMILRFELREDHRQIVIRGDNLPWLSLLLKPTLGESVTGMLGPCRSRLILNPDLQTGTAEGGNWQLEEAECSADLSLMPERLGLSGVTGKLDVAIAQAFGRTGGLAALQARLKSTEEGGTIPAAALQRLNYLLTGREIPPVTEDARFESLDVKVIFTGHQFYLQGDLDLRTAGAAKGTRYSLPGEPIPMLTLLKRLGELERRWKDAHSS